MNTTIINMNDGENGMEFTLKGVDVSVANAIRRTLLSDIPAVVFRTFGEQKDSVFTINTSRLNNEILGQRLSCIPIHLTHDDPILKDLLLEVDELNDTDTIRTITTDDFKIKLSTTGEYLPKNRCREIFRPYVSPLNDDYYIQFVRLRPRISPEIPGEHIAFTCGFSVGYASENSMFNVVGTCAYGMTVDEERAEQRLAELVQTWGSSGMTTDIIEHDATNWRLLEKKRFVLANSFDFIIKTVGPIPNVDLVIIACNVLIEKFKRIMMDIANGGMVATNTMSNDDSVEYILENEDYTVGNVLNYLMFKNYYKGIKTLSFCGFKKMHPHDTNSVIRLMFKSETDINAAGETDINAAPQYQPSPEFSSTEPGVGAPQYQPSPIVGYYDPDYQEPDDYDYPPDSAQLRDDFNKKTGQVIWEKHMSEQYKKIYYFNKITGEVKWENPDIPVPKKERLPITPPYPEPARYYATTPPSPEPEPVRYYATTPPSPEPVRYKQGISPTEPPPPEQRRRPSPQSGGGELNTKFRTLGFGYITKCCEDAILIFESIHKLF